MSLSSDFCDDPLKFMRGHSLYLPGTGAEGGSINFNEPKFAVYTHTRTPIKIDATPVQAAWKQHLKANHVKLVLRNSQNYEYGGAGTAEMNRHVYAANAGNDGASAKEAARYAKAAQKTTGEYVSKKEWFDCYFLPYSQGRYVYMTLGTDCDYFFTATMNGCSFIASGNPQAPIVSHVNTTQAADTLPGAVVTKATIRGRYGDQVNMGPSNTSNAALLGKYKAAESTPALGVTVGFKGSMQKYKIAAGELNAFTGPEIVREMDGSLAADINCFLVGVRGKAGWQFYFQRAATIKTRFDQTKKTPADFSALSRSEKFSMKFGGEAPYYENTNNIVAVLNHSLTACERLNFPARVG